MSNEKENENLEDSSREENEDSETEQQDDDLSSETIEGPEDPRDKVANINLLMDISLPISVELGQTKMKIKDILYLSQGSIIELNKFAGESLDILINNKAIAKGEVVVIDENFGIRITETLDNQEKHIISEASEIQK